MWRARDRHNGRAWLAWHTAALSGRERLPDLKTLMAPTSPSASSQARRPQQSVGQQRQMLQLLSEAYGIPLRQAAARPLAHTG